VEIKNMRQQARDFCIHYFFISFNQDFSNVKKRGTNCTKAAMDDSLSVTNEAPPCKKICACSKSIKPDVKITVGGVEFWEYSQSLCRWSDYFDTALNNGMKESTSKEFNFPDKDPKEWEWLVEFSSSLTGAELTMDNIDAALSWFDLLCSRRGLDRCDCFFLFKIIPTREAPKLQQNSLASLSIEQGEIQKKGFGYLLDALDTSIEYKLPRTNAHCVKRIKKILRCRLESSRCLTEESLSRLVRLCTKDETCLDRLWSAFTLHLSESSLRVDRALLVQSGLLSELVWLNIQARASIHVGSRAWNEWIDALEKELSRRQNFKEYEIARLNKVLRCFDLKYS